MVGVSAKGMRQWVVGLGLALAAVLAAPSIAPPARAAPMLQSAEPRQTFSDSPSFRIPFNIQDPATLEQIAEVHLYVSADRGLSWQHVGKTSPNQLAFPYRASHDGEYWFAVRTRDRQDRLYPPDMEEVKPKLRVVVDTAKPAVVLRPQPRRGGVVGVLWEVQDENLDLSSFALEYQVQGAPANSWRRVQTQPRLVGEERWEVGTGYPVTVRLSIADRAGNRGGAERVLPDGLAEAPGSTIGPAAGSAPPPIMQAGRANERLPGPTVVDDPFAGIDEEPSASPPPQPSRAQQQSQPQPAPQPRAPAAASNPATNPPRPPAEPANGGGGGGGGGSGGASPLIVGSPRFPLQYDVEDGSSESLSVVEMWVTADGGQNWQSLGTDPDRQSPFFVDVGGDGRYGLRIVVQSLNGLGDARPTPGSPPQVEVIVDTTPPRVVLDAVGLGSGSEAGGARRCLSNRGIAPLGKPHRAFDPPRLVRGDVAAGDPGDAQHGTSGLAPASERAGEIPGPARRLRPDGQPGLGRIF